MIAPAEDISMCSIGKWYDSFVGKTFKSRIIPLPREFVTYLGEDGIILPKGSKNYFSGDVLSDDEDDQLREVDVDDSSGAPDFSELDHQIAQAIRELEGDVIVKLNWSCPIDAVWVNAGTLKCKSPSDVYLMLKSSDRITFDLEHMFDLCHNSENSSNTITEHSSSSISSSETKAVLSKDEVTLVLRKWANLNPAMEFRVFVHGRRITGICQRDCSTYYDFLEEKIDEIQDLIYNFYYGNNSSHYSSTEPGAEKASFRVVGRFPLQNYTMDVYVDNRKRVWLIDFNPFGEPTCSLLFEWHELTASADETNLQDLAKSDDLASTIANDLSVSEKLSGIDIEAEVSGLASRAVAPIHDFCEFRYIEDSASVLPSTKGSSRGPIDVHAASEFNQFMKLCKDQQTQESDSDE